MRGTLALFTSLALGSLLASSPARADDDRGEAARARSIERDGRGLLYGVSAAFLLGATPLAPLEGEASPAPSPGFVVRGRVGWELPPGITLGLVVGGGGLVSEQGRSTLLLGGLVEGRYTIDVTLVRPFASLALGLALLKEASGLRATFTSEASVGVEVPLAPWAALEASLGAELLAPGDALESALVLAILPRIGVGFRY